jgi:heterodisulfide reductase subunit A
MEPDKNDTAEPKIGFFICHCGSNIAKTVDVEAVADHVGELPGVTVSRNYEFMCSEPGQNLIEKDIEELGLDRVVVAACSPMMHEPTFRAAVGRAGLNPYLFQMVNVREHCSWIHEDIDQATGKAKALTGAAIERVAHQEPLFPSTANVHPDTVIIGAGIAGIQAALDISEAGQQVYLVERESTIGGNMARFDKTFPTLDCSSCILTPKMVDVAMKDNIHILSMSELDEVSGFAGNFQVKVRKQARYVTTACTSCQACIDVCPIQVPSTFDMGMMDRTAIHKSFPQAVPNQFVIEKDLRPPCWQACPIGQEAAGYIALIAEGRYAEAAALIRQSNPLPVVCGRVCYHPCEGECNRGFVEEPIAIQHLKRFALDWEAAHNGEVTIPEPAERHDEKVAIVGSGPAGLACAHELAKRGYASTVFEREDVLGGMLALGIPRYRLPQEQLDQDIDYIRRMGVEFRTGVDFGRDVTLEQLRSDGYGAFFLATGAHLGIPMGIPGEEFDGVVDAVEGLQRKALGEKQKIKGKVAVIGGGNCGIDAARTALREGADEVTVVYRRTRVEMPCEEHEAFDAEAEGIDIMFLKAPVEVLGAKGKVTGLRCVDMELGEPDDTGRRRPMPVDGSEHDLQFDMVLSAIGQRADLDYLELGVGEISVSPWGTLDVDTETYQTNVPGVFAGGDAVTGPATVVAAMGAGKRAGEAIHKYLRRMPLEDFSTHMAPAEIERHEDRPHRYSAPYDEIPKEPRQEMPKLEAEARLRGWDEVEQGFTEEQAVAEAKRCLNCGVCVECMRCVDACLPNAIDHQQKDEVLELEVGQILVSTGFKQFDASEIGRYGYGRLPNVITGLEFERMLSSTGPTDGKVLVDGRAPRRVAVVHCVGSRDENYRRYCSRVCCMYALKFSHLVKERTEAEVFEFYIDQRAYGKGYEEFYTRIMDEGTTMVRGRLAEVVEIPDEGEGGLLVKGEDTLLGIHREIPVDLVILATAMDPSSGSEELRQLLHISKSADGFMLERHPKLDPVGTANDGIYIAGCAQGPKDIPDSVAQASAAASKMLGWIARGEIVIDPVKAEVNEELCGGCRICNALCPYNAIEWDAEKKVARVVDALCKGCGTCVAACPASAIAGLGFTDEQIYAELAGLLAV